VTSWSELEHAAPDIARAGRRLLEDADGRPDAAFLATVSAEGRPRLHPFVPAIVDGAMYAFIMPSPKRRDLDRTGAFALHSCLGRDDESFFVAGRARHVTDEPTRQRVAACMPYDDVDDNHRLYEFAVEHALWTTWTTPTSPLYRRWPDS
jgi:hypothetical protein